MAEHLCGLLPVCGKDPEILILGSFPSLISLEKQEYYGNPKNQFWRILEEIFGINSSLSYERRKEYLKKNGIALWDVASECRREGSSDSTLTDVKPNDIVSFINTNKSVRIIVLNGKTGAGKYFKKFNTDLSELYPDLKVFVFPSSSSANAVYSFDEKVRQWSVLKEYISGRNNIF